jgi:predicted RNA-binding Zn-ribbon protein involved in translation (DUF1610 family)
VSHKLRLTCPTTGKQVFGTVERATAIAARVSAHEGRPYRPYRCPHCGWLHLTSKPVERR